MTAATVAQHTTASVRHAYACSNNTINSSRARTTTTTTIPKLKLTNPEYTRPNRRYLLRHTFLTLADTNVYRVGSYSINFDGINDDINCGNQATRWSQSKTKFSFSFWFYPTAYATAGDARDLVRFNFASNGSFIVYMHDTDTKVIKFTIFNDAGASNSAYAFNSVPELYRWYHVVCTFDNSLGTQNVKIYVDGVIGSPLQDLTGTVTGSNNLLLGGVGNDLAGNIKDFRWWTTKALTQAELDNVRLNNQSAPTPDYWLKMEEGTGTPVDSIGSLTTTLPNGGTWHNTVQQTLPDVWLGKFSKYLYKIQARASLSRIYKYNLQARVSLSRIYKYKIQARVSLSRIYQYKIVGRISLSRIYKYNLVGRISLSRIYKYNLQSRISLSRIYKYSILGRISLSRVYKYNLIGRVSLSRVYKYNLVSRVSLSRVYKYNIAIRVSLSRIYKYNLLARVSLSRTYVYNILAALTRISLSRIYKYDIRARVSLSRAYKYSLISTSTQTIGGGGRSKRRNKWRNYIASLVRSSKPFFSTRPKVEQQQQLLQQQLLLEQEIILTRVSLSLTLVYNILAPESPILYILPPITKAASIIQPESPILHILPPIISAESLPTAIVQKTIHVEPYQVTEGEHMDSQLIPMPKPRAKINSKAAAVLLNLMILSELEELV